MIRDRIKDFRRAPVADLLENGRNSRRHPQAQKDALAGALAEVGIRESPRFQGVGQFHDAAPLFAQSDAGETPERAAPGRQGEVC